MGRFFCERGINLKKVFSYIPALLPVVFIASLLVAAALLFPLSLFLKPPKTVWITEGILAVVVVLYGWRLNNFFVNACCKWIYWGVEILTIGLFVIFECQNWFPEYQYVVVLQIAMLLVYSVLFERWLQKVKRFFQKSRKCLVALNVFDSIFIILFWLIIKNGQVNENGSMELSAGNQKMLISVLVLIVLMGISILRTRVSIEAYKKQNAIRIARGRILFFSYLTHTICSFLLLGLYGYYLSSNSNIFSCSDIVQIFSDIVSICIAMVFSMILWCLTYYTVNEGDMDKKDAVVIGMVIFVFILFNQIESDLIGILAWFFPVLIPTLIGEINSQDTVRKEGRLVKPTLKMKRHLHWMQMVSFNTLMVLNILSSLSTTKKIENNEIIEINQLKKILVDMMNRSGTGNEFLISLFVSIVLVFISFIISIGISKGMMLLLKRYYLEPSNGYFE